MRILGISSCHDCGVCVYSNGKIEFYSKEERLSKIKRDNQPWLSLAAAKENLKGDVDFICLTTPANGDPLIREMIPFIQKQFPNVPLLNYSDIHHLIHASLAFYNSGFEECLVFVIDRNGSVLWYENREVARESESVFVCSYPHNIEPIYKNFWLYNPNYTYDYENIVKHVRSYYPKTDINIRSGFGITKVYEAATSLIGQHPLENGKTMGLSSYGSDKQYHELFINSTPIDMYFHHETNFNYYYEREIESRFSDVDLERTRVITFDNYQPYADKAKHVQLKTQKAALNLIQKYVEKTGIKNVCITGGYGLNILSNSYYVDSMPDINFYFEPLADDSGNSIGAAMFKYRIETQDTKIYPLKDTFFQYYRDDLDPSNFPLTKETTIEEVAKLLSENKTIALFGGLPEAGPRSLGNRSIIANAKNKNCRELINKIKNREWYRPFAGVTKKENFEKYFDTMNLEDSEFMTLSFKASKDCVNSYPGIIHVDNTCRIQTVKDGIFYNLLNELEKYNIDILLNTSFNLSGKPLVNDVKDAIETFYASDLDYIYFYDKNILMSKDCKECKI